MASPRKAKSPFGPRVVPRRKGPQLGDTDAVSDIAARVRQIRDRMADTDVRTGARLQLTARRFSDQIGITEQSFNLKIRKTNPTPFTPEELAAICRAFCVRAEYILLGNGPMLHEDIVDGRVVAPQRFASALRNHMQTVVASKLDQEVEWVDGFLPPAEPLLVAVESGVADGVASSVNSLIERQLRSSAAIRSAIAERMKATAPPSIDKEDFSEATEVASRGDLVVMPQTGGKDRG